MSLSRRQIIEAGAATGALGLMASSPLLAQVVRPSSPVPSPASPPLAVPAAAPGQIVAAVPEPSTLLLFAVMVAGLLLGRSVRRGR